MSFNVAEFLEDAARQWPQGSALFDGGRHWTFEQLSGITNGYAAQLSELGFRPGMKVLMLVSNSAEFVAMTFAVFRLGCVPVLIDPGMGVKRMVQCIEDLSPEGLVAVPKGHLLSRFFRKPFQTAKVRACLGRFPGVPTLRTEPLDEFPRHLSEPTDLAAVLFTSGSTGPAKGVLYRHEIFRAQVNHLKELYGFEPGEIDFPGFPLFALFSTAMGVACVIPTLDPSKPAGANPASLVTAIHKHGVTSLQGSPAIWRKVGDYCEKRGTRLPTVRRLLTFGAPIELEFLEQWRKILSKDAKIFTPYGATEGLPVASIDGEEALATRARRLQGAGICVGRPVLDLAIIPITDEPLDAIETLPTGEVGEVAVQGTVVTWGYHKKPEADRVSKVGDPPELWHRMGDMGYLDEAGKLWLMGRKSHRVESGEQRFYPLAAEGMVNSHPFIRRSALVGVEGEPVIIVEKSKTLTPEARLTKEVLQLLERHPKYNAIKRVLFHPSFPVDPRHNAKIHREELAVWAAKRLKHL